MKKKIRRCLALLLVKFLILLSRVLSRRLGRALFAWFGSIAFRFYRKDRERAIRNVSLAFPDCDPMIAGAIVKGSFRVLGQNVLDALKLIYISRDEIFGMCRVEGEENLREPYERGRGVVAVTGHIGCWELLAAYFSEKGYRVGVIARDLHDERLNDILVGMRKRHGIVSVPRGSSAVSAYKILRRGGIIGMLIDQAIDVDGVFVPFFGVPAHTPRGAAAFALKSGAAVVPMAIHTQPQGGHKITVLPELEPPPEELPGGERVDELTRMCSEALERLIRIYPQQWVWFHDRWRIKPERRGKKDCAGLEEKARFV